MMTYLRPAKQAVLAPHKLLRRRRRRPPATFSRTFFRRRPRLEVMEDRTLLSTFLVTNTGDSGPGSLRQAILDSNDATGATITIDFDIGGSGVQTIYPLSTLPAISSPVLIDATSQPGYAGTPLIEINGTQLYGSYFGSGNLDGLTITGSGVTVRGLDIDNIGNFSTGIGIELTGPGATGDWIYGNFLGTDPTGTTFNNSSRGQKYGIEIDGGASDNLIGTNGDGIDDSAERNLISGNIGVGVLIQGQGTDGNVVAGNWIGTTVTGDVALGNGTYGYYYGYGSGLLNAGGVMIVGGASGNVIGTDGLGVDAAGQGNVISGNDNAGVAISGSSDNVVAGNEIGTDATGSISLPNQAAGIVIEAGSTGNTIGGTTAVSGNLITNNGGPGVVVGTSASDLSIGNQITDNRIFANSKQAIDLGDDGVTDNASAPRQGPNNLQNFPIIVTIADGQLEGWLGGSTPDTTFRIDVYASTGDNSDGSGEAQDDLGSFDVTTDATGQVTFAVPFTAPAGLPDISATATDPAGNTSEVSAARQGVWANDASSIRPAPGQSVNFSAASGQEIALQDPSAGPLLAIWDISLTVPAGTLNLATTAGLTGSGDGTGSLSYQGSIAAIDAGLDGLIYTPPPGTSLDVAITLDATSVGAAPVQSQAFVTYGPFVVTTTADSGPWSLRQAILDSDGATGATNTIDFALQGSGVQTIVLLSALPAISNAVLIDGTSQPGYAGTPLIELNGSQAGGGDALMITGSGVTVVGLDIDSFGQGAGIEITDPGATGDWIHGDFLGTDPTGTQAEPNEFGVEIDGGATNNLIGTNGDGINDAAEQDVISGNSAVGVLIKGQGTDGNIVAGNLIGTTVTGDVALANGAYPYKGSYPSYNYSGSGSAGGVMIVGGASGNRIGTDGVSVDDAGQGNVISGNDNAGVAIGGSSDNAVAGNFIGTDATGSLFLPNQAAGIVIAEASTGNTIGGTTAVSGNLIANNGGPGVVVGTSASDLSTGNPITDNRIFANTGQAIDLGDDGVTDNASATRQGPNNLQNFPILFLTPDGQIEGWLGGSTSDTTFRIDFFASAALGPGGSGDAQDDLGSIEVTTDAAGGVSFAVPFTAPDGLPILTATATDPDGNTSEVSAIRQGVFDVPTEYVRFTAGQAFHFSAASGDAIALDDPDVGPFDLTWSLTLSVTTGTLTLSSTAGLTGSGNGTNSLSYSGLLSALDAALAGMTFRPPAVSYGYVTLSLDARSDGAATVDSQVLLSDGLFLVTTTADSGPGSLRQAILDSNSAVGATTTIDFAIPGTGIRTIAPTSALPAITTAVVIDGTSQPGFAGTPRIDLSGQSLAGTDPLAVASNVTVRGVVIGGFGFGVSVVPEVLDLPSLAFPASGVGPASSIVSYPFETSTGEDLTIVAQAQGVTTQLLLLDASGNLLMQSDGQSAADGDDLINTYVPAGTYSLEVQDLGGAGTYSVTATALAATSPLQPLAMGHFPESNDSIVAGDFTGDGRLDLAFTSFSYFNSTAVVSVLLSNGDGTFAPPVNYAVGSQPWALVEGDFTGDGRIDLAVVNNGGYPDGTVSVLLDNGDGTFQPQVTYAVGSDPRAIVAGDFTGDGHLDLAVANYLSDTVSMLIGNGDGTFQSQVTYAVGRNPDALVAGDFTGDGHLDLAVVNSSSSTVSMLLGHGNGTFAPQVTYTVGSNPQSIVAGDFNDDGHLDLAVSGFAGVQILLGNGEGTFQAASTAANGIDGALVACSITGDGHLDLAVVSYEANIVSVLLGNGDGTFQPPVIYSLGASPSALVSGDFIGDGRIDLAVVMSYTPGGTPLTGVSLLLGYGDGTFLPLGGPTGNAVGTAPGSVAAGDFTGDGRIDLAVVNRGDNTVSVLLGNGDGTFAPQATYAVGTGPSAIVVGDFNVNGRLDLAVANYNANTVSVLLGKGDGTFAPQVTYAVGTEPDRIVAGDFNGDGPTDLAVANYGDDTVSVLLNDGDGTFAAQVPYAVGPRPDAIVAGDFNGDGPTDLAVANSGSNSVSVLLGKGDGTFAAQVNYAVGTAPVAMVTGDFNGDGRIDLAVANQGIVAQGPGSVSVLLGHGDGTFAPQVTYNLSENPLTIVAGDFTGDGDLDLLLTTEFVYTPNQGTEIAYPISVLLGHGDGTFARGYRSESGLSVRDRGGQPQRRWPSRPGRHQYRIPHAVGDAG